MAYYTLTFPFYSNYTFSLPYYFFSCALDQSYTFSNSTLSKMRPKYPLYSILLPNFIHLYMYFSHFSCTSQHLARLLTNYWQPKLFYRASKCPTFDDFSPFSNCPSAIRRDLVRAHISISSCQLNSSYCCIAKFSSIHFQAAVVISKAISASIDAILGRNKNSI